MILVGLSLVAECPVVPFPVFSVFYFGPRKPSNQAWRFWASLVACGVLIPYPYSTS